MKYAIGDRSFGSKKQITELCQEIRNNTPDGEQVEERHLNFLFGLFQYHDEWDDKSQGDICGITTMTTDQGTRCFALIKKNGEKLDISYPHSIKCIPTSRSPSRIPQGLIDFRNGARAAVQEEIEEFRKLAFSESVWCDITGVQLEYGNSHVDHIYPDTFDALLYSFCKAKGVMPCEVNIGSENGVVPFIENDALRRKWCEWHSKHSKLRVISKLANLQLKKNIIDWSDLLE